MPTVQFTDDFNHTIDGTYYTAGFATTGGTPSQVGAPLYRQPTSLKLPYPSGGSYDVGVRRDITSPNRWGWMGWAFRLETLPITNDILVGVMESTSGATTARFGVSPTGTLYAYIVGAASQPYSGSPIAADTWYWMEAILDANDGAGNATLYWRVNGVNQTSPASLVVAGSTVQKLMHDTFNAGQCDVYVSQWKGGIPTGSTDWLGEPTATTYADTVLSLQPTAYWPFSGSSPLLDIAGGITATTWGSPSRADSLVPKEAAAANNAYYLNGTSGFDAGDVLDETGDSTFAAWIKPDTGCWDFWPILQKQGGSPANGYSWHRSLANFTFDASNAGTSGGTTLGGAIAIGTRVFVVHTYDSGASHFSIHYENAVQMDSGSSLSFNPGDSTVPLIIGGNQAKDTSGTGWIDEVAVWTGVKLTPTQITSLYTAGLAEAVVTGVSNRYLIRSSRGTSW